MPINQSEVKQRAKEKLKGKWGDAAIFTAVYMLLLWSAKWLLTWIPYIGPIVFFIVAGFISFILFMCFLDLINDSDVTAFGAVKKIPHNFSPACKLAVSVVLKMIPYAIVCTIVLDIIAMANSAYSMGDSFWSLSAFSDSAIPITMGIIILFIVFMIPFTWGAVKGSLYAFSCMIFRDNEGELSEKDALEKSRYILYDSRKSFFILLLSFFGWVLPAVIIYLVLYNLLYPVLTVLPDAVISLIIFIPGVAGFFWLLPYVLMSMAILYEKLLKKKEEEDKKRGYTVGNVFSDYGEKNWTSRY